MKKITTVLIAVFASMMLVACGSDGETTMDNGRDTNGMAGEPVATAQPDNNNKNNDSVVDKAMDAEKDMVDGATNATKDAVDGVGNAAKDMVDGAKNAVDSAAEGMNNAADGK